MIIIKDSNVLQSLLSNQYKTILIDIVNNINSITGGIVITEGYREGTGVHSTNPCRGIDLRSWIYTSTQLDKIENYVNIHWIYDPNRPKMKCCLIHNTGKGEHIHLQVHPNTIWRK